MDLNCSDCECVTEPGPTLTWWMTCGDPVAGPHCMDPPPEGPPACTAEQTMDGACTEDRATCDSSPAEGCGGVLICAAEDPIDPIAGCPISRRRYKRDIEYLGASDLHSAHHELMSLPLASYRYRRGDPRTHLGFIMEDVEPSVAVDSDRGIVDLYSYTTMAVAALKVQEERIRALERELELLRAGRAVDAAPMCR